MPFVCGGYPVGVSLARTLPALADAGASIIEVGFAFSDPIADGPVIAAAMHEALEAGTCPDKVFEEVKAARRSDACRSVGLVAMVSISIVERIGRDRFIRSAAEAGFDGFIFPDAPLEESDALLTAAETAGMTASLLVAPTTRPERAAAVAARCTGFVYMLARKGITGSSGGSSSTGIEESLRSRIDTLRASCSLPIACGFGIASPEMVRQVVHESGADAAIVGSVLVRRMGEASRNGADPVEAAAAIVHSLSAGLCS